MGTRADFYVGRGIEAEWLGSIAWDGYPSGIDEAVLTATNEAQYRERVSTLLAREDGTTPDMGWPWPWEDSQTTDFAYALDDGKVYASCFGHKWFAIDMDDDNYGEDADDESDKSAVFPNMKDRQNVTFGRRSGMIIIGGAL